MGREALETGPYRLMLRRDLASLWAVSAVRTAPRLPTGWARTIHRRRQGITTIMFASCTVHAGNEVTKSHVLIWLLALGACATMRDEQPGPFSNLAIALSPGWIGDRPAVVTSITNRSSAPICIRAEALRNPWSNEITLRLRDERGRRISLYRAHGSSEPQLDETVRLEPGMSARGQLYLERFKRVGNGRALPNGWRIQADIPYGDCQPREAYCVGRVGLCPNDWSSRATSTWQPLTFTSRD